MTDRQEALTDVRTPELPDRDCPLCPRLAAFRATQRAAHPEDGLALHRARITNAVRCVPPQNRPEPAEIEACGRFLVGEFARLPRLKAILALGAIAHNAVLAAKGLRRARYPFAHGAVHELPDRTVLADSYHCSRLNTNTGRLTLAMFEAVIGGLAERLPQ